MSEERPRQGWFADPEDESQLRWWDGSAWTEHRSPRPASTTGQLQKAGSDLAEGIARGFTALGAWVNQNTSSDQTPDQTSGPIGGQGQAAPAHPTFESLAASCRDQPALHPLSVKAELEASPALVAAIAGVYAAVGVQVTHEGTSLGPEICRLVPNPWDPSQPSSVAVFVGARLLGRLPVHLERTYCAPLAQLTSKGLLATGTIDLWAQASSSEVSAARATVHLPVLAALTSPT